jgi:glycosyltransferase involved in cell wall biosynthesis
MIAAAAPVERMRTSDVAEQGSERTLVETAGDPRVAARSPMRLLVAGGSLTPVCGLRDHHRVLQASLVTLGVAVETVWWEREGRAGLRASLESATAWCGRVSAAAKRLRPDVLLWQYVPTTYGFRGVPVFVPFVTRRLAKSGVPMVPFLHELMYPWGRRGLRGTVHAVTTRMALLSVLRVARGVVVTTEGRQAWLERSWWTPRRPVDLSPVFSNVQVVDRWRPTTTEDGRVTTVGVFGFGSDGFLVDVVTEALAILRRRGRPVRLLLIGSPGPVGGEADRWRRSCRRYEEALPEFTGILEPPALSKSLARLDVLVMPDATGPTSRKGTLAAGLAHGLPIVAFEAPGAWRSLVREGAVALAGATPDQLADRLDELLQDGVARANLGARGTAFYGAHLEPVRVAEGLVAFLRRLRMEGVDERLGGA